MATNNMAKQHKIFISHASEQDEEAIALATQLRNTGFEDIWLDRNRVRPGIRVCDFVEALDHCTLFILCLSPEAINSPWVQREANWVASRGNEVALMIVPVSGANGENWNRDGKFSSIWNRQDIWHILTAKTTNREMFMRQMDSIIRTIANSDNGAGNERYEIPENEWNRIWIERFGENGVSFYNRYQRLTNHVTGIKQLSEFLREIADICEGNNTELDKKARIFLAAYPANYIFRFKEWLNFAKRQGIGTAWNGDVEQFSFAATVFDPKTVIPHLNRYLQGTSSVTDALAQYLLVGSGAPDPDDFPTSCSL